jgi:dTDP-4-amino-4,6-dideoxygalactose transaminase
VITKSPCNIGKYWRPIFSFPNARTAFKAYLQTLHLRPQDEIMMPAYIGWSSNEGSGVFDPIKELGIGFRFYRINEDLTIDLADLQVQMRCPQVRVLLLIHYFGFPDPNLATIVRFAREQNLIIIEDEAHALYSDWWGGITGHCGDVAFFSLHKMLPFPYGGWLVLNNPSSADLTALESAPWQVSLPQDPRAYDWTRIAIQRRENARILLDLLMPLEEEVSVLFPTIPKGVVPQTVPILIRNISRDELYFKMNENGYGVVSLYHTLIDQIDGGVFPVSHKIARQILNLPVHQDISPIDLGNMVACLQKMLFSLPKFSE